MVAEPRQTTYPAQPSAPTLRPVKRSVATAPAEARDESIQPVAVSKFQQFNLIASTLAWACTTVLVVTFTVAALSPGNSVLVTVNDYGEMGVEAVVLGFTWAAISLNLGLLWRRAWAGKRY